VPPQGNEAERGFHPPPVGRLAGVDKPLPDVVAPGLDVLFCGINPSLMSAARGHHFARPGNRFWPALHLAGLTPRRLTPDEDGELLRYGLGVTNVVARPTRAAAELDPAELREGAIALAELVARHRPRVLAVLGITAWRVGFDRPRAAIGRQPERIGGSDTWVVPNPSGLNAHYQLPDLARSYRQLLDTGTAPGTGQAGGAAPRASVSASTVAGSSSRAPKRSRS
jgi:double-stranded uracil-DNA glycosylase